MSDQNLADRFGRSKSWVLRIRRRYGIAAAIQQGHRDSTSRFGFVPGEEAHEARYAAFFAEHGAYPSFTAHDITMIELGKRSVALGKPRARSVTAAFFGDPAPDRPRA